MFVHQNTAATLLPYINPKAPQIVEVTLCVFLFVYKLQTASVLILQGIMCPPCIARVSQEKEDQMITALQLFFVILLNSGLMMPTYTVVLAIIPFDRLG